MSSSPSLSPKPNLILLTGHSSERAQLDQRASCVEFERKCTDVYLQVHTAELACIE